MIDLRRVLPAGSFLARKDSPPTDRVTGNNPVGNAAPARRQGNGTPTGIWQDGLRRESWTRYPGLYAMGIRP